jgi:hypothetical protein
MVAMDLLKTAFCCSVKQSTACILSAPTQTRHRFINSWWRVCLFLPGVKQSILTPKG